MSTKTKRSFTMKHILNKCNNGDESKACLCTCMICQDEHWGEEDVR